jgi:hypothetical protein
MTLAGAVVVKSLVDYLDDLSAQCGAEKSDSDAIKK